MDLNQTAPRAFWKGRSGRLESCTSEGSFSRAILDALAKEYDFSLADTLWDYPKEIQDVIINGTGGLFRKVYYKGSAARVSMMWRSLVWVRNVEQRYRDSDAMKQEYESFMRITPVLLRDSVSKESLAVTVADKNIYEITNLSIQSSQGFFGNH